MRYWLLICFPLLLCACHSNKGKLRISGEMKNLDQADFLLFSPDGGIDDIDTLHLKKGKFEKEIPLKNGPYTFTVVYPNYQTISFIASERSNVKINGDALALSQVQITGADSVFVATDSVATPTLKKGTRLPKTALSDCKVFRDKKYVLVGFWAYWKGGSSVVNFSLRRAHEEYEHLNILSVTFDVDPQMRRIGEMQAGMDCETFCDYQGLSSPVFKKLGLTSLPYLILISPDGKVVAHGKDYNDIDFSGC